MDGYALVLLALAAGYAGSTVLWVQTAGTDRQERRAWLGLLSAVGVAHLGYMAWRWIASGHAPMAGTYENVLAATFLLAVPPLVSAWAGWEHSDVFMAALAPWIIGLCAYGAMFPGAPVPVEARRQSLLAYAHALAGWVSMVPLAFATGTGALAYSVSRRGRRPQWMPGDADLEHWIVRALGFAFIGLAATAITGSALSMAVFGVVARLEAVFLATMVLLLITAAALHARALLGLRGPRLMLAVVAIAPPTLVAFWGWSLYSGTYHAFDNALRAVTGR